MKEIDNIKLLNEPYLPEYQYKDNINFVQKRFDMSTIHGIHNYWKDDSLRAPYLCNYTCDIITHMNPIIPKEWVNGLFDKNPGLKYRLLELNKISPWMTRAWLSILIGQNKLRLYNKIILDDFPLGICFMGNLALIENYNILKNIDIELKSTDENIIIRLLILAYAHVYSAKTFERAINYTLCTGKYAAFWQYGEWNNKMYDSWIDIKGISASYTGLYKKDGTYYITYKNKPLDIFSDKFLESIPEHQHLDGLYMYLFKNPNEVPEIATEDFFDNLKISLQ